MENKTLLSVLLALILLLAFSFVSADSTVTVNTANNTEFNTLTPSINVTVVGNCSNYNVNITANGAVVKSQVVVNNTATLLTTSSLTASTNYLYNISATNETCDSGVINSSSNYRMEINARPSITSVSKSTAGYLLLGNTLTWTTVWADQNSTGTDSVIVYVCKTDAFTSAGCTSAEWGHSSAETDNSTTVSYTTTISDLAGLKNYYVYLIDNNNYSVSASTSGTFTVSRPAEEVTDEKPIVVVKPEAKLPTGYIAIAIIIIIVIFLVLRKKR